MSRREIVAQLQALPERGYRDSSPSARYKVVSLELVDAIIKELNPKPGKYRNVEPS